MALSSFSQKSPRYVTYLLMWVLLVMTLMRLVWMQRRDYQFQTNFSVASAVSSVRENKPCEWPEEWPGLGLEREDAGLARKVPARVKNWFSVTGLVPMLQPLCETGVFDAAKAIRLNQWLWVFVVFLCALLIRLVGQSWLVCLLVVTSLMSRGRFIATIAHVTADIPAAVFFSLCFAILILFLRSSSWWSFGGYMAMAFLGCFFHKSFIVMLFLPMALSLLTRFVHSTVLGDSDSGASYKNWQQIFRDREVSWASWNNKRNWLKVSWWSALLLIVMGALIGVNFFLAYELVFGDLNLEMFPARYTTAISSVENLSYRKLFQFLDLHYLASLMLVIGYASYGRLNKSLVWACRVLCLAVPLFCLAAFFVDSLDVMIFESVYTIDEQARLLFRPAFSDVFFWSEPVLISLGIAVLCQMIARDLRTIFRADK